MLALAQACTRRAIWVVQAQADHHRGKARVREQSTRADSGQREGLTMAYEQRDNSGAMFRNDKGDEQELLRQAASDIKERLEDERS